jgi:hypothetical protein
MTTESRVSRMSSAAVLACALGMVSCQFDPPTFFNEGSSAYEASAQSQAATPTPDTANASQLVIDTTSLPTTYPRAVYSVKLQQHGGIPPIHWKVEKGELPPGLNLEDDGTLHGSPEKLGEYRFTISVTDSSKRPQAVQREYVLNVVAAMSMIWKTPAHVVGNRIEGSVQVTNTTVDDFDFTLIVLAVNEIGRATAIGYQHFPLKKGTTDFEIPFGDTVPHGAYLVHVDGVAEVAEKNQIHRARLQTPGALQVAVGP